MRCPNCGNEMEDTARFCTRCGTKLEPIQDQDHSVCNDVYEDENISGDSQAISSGSQADITEYEEDNKNGKKPFVWKEKYTYIAMGIVAVLAVVAGMAVRTMKESSDNEAYALQNPAGDEKDAEMMEMQEEDPETTDDQQDNDDAENSEIIDDTEDDDDYEEVEEKESTYTYVIKDVSWQQAAWEAENAGGHLAVISDEEEYYKICDIANASGLTYIWIGARLNSSTDCWYDVGWITGEEWTFEKWYPNEPSGIDAADNVEELYLCLWNAKYNNSDIGWTYNDQRDDIVGAFPSISGKVGYIVEFEE